MAKIILINGPPRSGKDAAAIAISSYFPDVAHAAFKSPLVRLTQEVGQVEYKRWFKDYEDKKDEPWEEYYGKSPREMMIVISEQWLKPTFGNDILGRMAVQRNQEYFNTKGFIVFSDSGFLAECEYVIKTWLPYESTRARNCLLLRIHRDGHDFSNDSRGYIDLGHLGVTQLDINNQFDELELYHAQIQHVVDKWHMGK